MKFVASSNLHLTNANIQAVKELTGYSERTFRTHFKWLSENGFVGYNPKTKCIFIRSFEKVCRIYRCESTLSLVVYSTELKDLRDKTYAGFVLSKAKNLSYHKRKSCSEKVLLTNVSAQSRPKHESLNLEGDMFFRTVCKPLPQNSESIARARSIKEPKVWFVNSSSDYAGVSNSLTAKNFNRSLITASRWKSRSQAKGFVNVDKVYRPEAVLTPKFNLEEFKSERPLTRQKIVVVDRGEEKWVCEQLEDMVGAIEVQTVWKSRYSK